MHPRIAAFFVPCVVYLLIGQFERLPFLLDVQVKPSAQTLNSCFSYIVRAPAESPSDGKDQVFIWIGSKAHKDDEKILRSICKQLYEPVSDAVAVAVEASVIARPYSLSFTSPDPTFRLY